jgi:hypothetical protein
VGVIAQVPPQTNKEATVLIKLLEASLGKPAAQYIAEVEAAKAKAAAEKEDTADVKVKETLEAVLASGREPTTLVSNLEQLQNLVSALEKGEF